MTSPSMQFAPAWLKKPSGTTSGGPPSSGGQSANSTLAFSQAVASAPTIGNLQHSSGMEEFPSTGTKQTGASNPLGQSYSQIASPRNEYPNYPNPGFSSGTASASVQLSSAIDGSASSGDNKARPFRYSREALLALFDEEKVRERPLELMEWAMHPNNNSGHAGAEEGGIASIILSDKAGIPMGLVEWTSEEKKVSGACASFERINPHLLPFD
jgi:PERQ amino acid-rich with GYF domain-containing protein